MKDWDTRPAPSATDAPVTVLLAGEVGPRLVAWQQAITMDARFRVAALANDPADFQAKLAYSPEVILLDALIFPGPQVLMQAVTSITGAVYIILPATVASAGDAEIRELPEKLKAIPAVKGVYIGDAPIADVLQRAYGDALALRRTVAAPAVWTTRPTGGGGVAGLRVIAVWNRAGGTGKTTIAAALGLAAARREIRSLLIGLDAPDLLPLHLGLKPEPNILFWFASPSDNGLKASLQQLGELDVVPGFPDILSEETGLKADERNSLASLATTAAYSGYAAIVFDVPAASSIASAAVMAANTWVMVARPTLADAWASVDAFRTVTQRAAGQHRIAPGNIFVVLNMRGNGMLSPNEWHAAADSACRKLGLQTGFPPVALTIPYLPAVPLAQDAGRPALDSSDEFARPIHNLADMLFGRVASGGDGRKGERGKRINLAGLTIRIKE